MRRRVPLLRTLSLLTALLVVAAAAFLGFGRMDRIVLAPGRLEGGSVGVLAPRDGTVAEMLVRSGEEVRADQELFRLEARALESESTERLALIEALRGELDARVAERSRVESAVHPRERNEAHAERERARIARARADIEATAARRLGEEGIVGRLQVERAEVDLRLAAQDAETAEASFVLLDARHGAVLAGLAAGERRLAGEIEAAVAAREVVLRDIAESTVTAPWDGMVVTRGLEELAGRAVREGDEVVRLRRGPPDRFEGRLKDAGRASVRAGQSVRIRLDGYPWLLHGSLDGVVTRVGERREEGGAFEVIVSVRSGRAPGPLREGMAGTARIVVEEGVPLGRFLLERLSGGGGP